MESEMSFKVVNMEMKKCVLDLRDKSVAEEVDFAYLFGNGEIGNGESYVVEGLILDKYKNKKLTKLFQLFRNGEIDVRYAYKVDIDYLCRFKSENLMEQYCGDNVKYNSQEDDICKKCEQMYELYKNKASLDDIYNIFIDAIRIEKYEEKIRIYGPSKLYEATTEAGAFRSLMSKYIPYIYVNGFLYIIQVDVYKLDSFKV